MCNNEKLLIDDGFGDAAAGRYRSLVGRLIYLTHTRLDILFSVGILSKYMSKPTRSHTGVGQRVLRYLIGISEFGIHYTHKTECKLERYSNSD